MTDLNNYLGNGSIGLPNDGDTVVWNAQLERWLPTAVAVGSGATLTHTTKAFAYDTAGLATGILVGYTPVVGDFLLAAWIDVSAGFDGTTPKADIGPALGGDTSGIMGSVGVLIVLDTADLTTLNGIAFPNGKGGFFNSAWAQATFRFTQAAPLKLWASQDGSLGGLAIGGAAGAATLHLLTLGA